MTLFQKFAGEPADSGMLIHIGVIVCDIQTIRIFLIILEEAQISIGLCIGLRILRRDGTRAGWLTQVIKNTVYDSVDCRTDSSESDQNRSDFQDGLQEILHVETSFQDNNCAGYALLIAPYYRMLYGKRKVKTGRFPRKFRDYFKIRLDTLFYNEYNN